jgi:predicted transcriptional regulator
LVRGVTDRIAEALENAGYRTVDQLAAETDVDRLAIKTGLDQKRAALVREGVAEYVEREAKS